MTGLELIVAALAAGAGAGASELATTAVRDAYAGLLELLRGRLRGREEAVRALQAQQIEPGMWQAGLGEDLVASGADRDEQVLVAARRLLYLVDPDGSGASKYRIDLHGATSAQIGDGTVHVDTNQGGAVGTFHAPVTFTAPPGPPASPAAG